MTSFHHGQGVFLVLIDLSTAFDTENHSNLFQRMQQELRISGTAPKWVKSYFSGRTTNVCINGYHPTKSSLNYRLPQGSIVGPVSFGIYTIPIRRIIRKNRLFTIFMQMICNSTPTLIHLPSLQLIVHSPHLPYVLLIYNLG